MHLPIVYRDDHYVVVNKPHGLLVHRTAISRDRVFALQILRDQIGQRVYPVHRLDRGTGGLLVFALSPEAAAPMAARFENQQVGKHYLAIVRGFAPEAGEIDRPLRNEERGEQAALTRFETLATVQLPIPVSKYPTARFSLVRLQPKTGRRHQLRRHMAGINHPVVGDVKHGDRHQNHFMQDHFGIEHLLLSAVSLAFDHPLTGQPLRLTCPPAWEALIYSCGLAPRKTDI